MDNPRSSEQEVDLAADYPPAREPRMEPPPAIGGDERRMHVRAYKFWVSLLGGRPFPAIDAFDPARLPDFGPHGVLLDFTGSDDDPRIVHLGEALRREGAIDRQIARISDVPGRSLLSRLTDHYLQIIANRAPIGFEAEFVNARGNNALYRGILMPFSSDGETIDHVYGVINWKEIADPATTRGIARAVDDALRAAPAPPAAGPLWADGPGTPLPESAAEPARRTLASLDDPDEPAAAAPAGPALGDALAAARGTVDLLRSAELRHRSALHRALGIAYDFACAAERDPAGFAALLPAAGIRGGGRGSAAAAVKLVFGAGHDPADRARFAAVIAHGRRLGIAPGAMRRLIEGSEGGIRGIAAAERAARRAD